ncbi:hypothetical protein [Kribbella sp. NPDC051770]|uniref:hypothetical protein n=1 Tax=Kribbella sp. NPDC051770 TaxID=3155413 RepID=UPI003445DAC4
MLVIALIISTQLLMLQERGRPLAKRLRDLGWGGDAFGLLWIAFLLLGGIAAFIGSFFDHPGPAAAIGMALALACWSTAVILAHRGNPGPGKHTSS